MRTSLTLIAAAFALTTFAGAAQAQDSIGIKTETVTFELDQKLSQDELFEDIKAQARAHCSSNSGSIAQNARTRKVCRADLVAQVVAQMGSDDVMAALDLSNSARKSDS